MSMAFYLQWANIKLCIASVLSLSRRWVEKIMSHKLLPNFSTDYNKIEKCHMHADTQSMFLYNTTTSNNSEQQKSTSNQTSHLD